MTKLDNCTCIHVNLDGDVYVYPHFVQQPPVMD